MLTSFPGLRSGVPSLGRARCLEGGGQDAESLGQQLVADGERRQEAQHVAVRSAGQDDDACLMGGAGDRTGEVWIRLGAAGLVAAAVLILLERAGKAVRSPSKSALLAHAAKAVGRGTGFGVHKALDQTGAFAGPLLVAAVVAVSSVRSK